MTTLIHKTGNIFDTTADAIGHGVNTHGFMGAGIAVQFRDRFPMMFLYYRQWCLEGKIEPGSTMIWFDEPSNQFICNIASQDSPGPFAQIDWLTSGVELSLDHLESVGASTLALPRIGSGIGGLDEAEVESVLKTLAANSSVDIELWTFKESK